MLIHSFGVRAGQQYIWGVESGCPEPQSEDSSLILSHIRTRLYEEFY